MPKIQLSPRGETQVSEEDYERVSAHVWYWGLFGPVNHKRPRAYRRFKKDSKWVFVYLHRWLFGEPAGKTVDHKNGDTLDNQRDNLRVCTQKQNMQNVRVRTGAKSSRFKGVYWKASRKCWTAIIKNHYIISCHDEEQAARAYNEKAVELFGEYARLNTFEPKQKGPAETDPSTTNHQERLLV